MNNPSPIAHFDLLPHGCRLLLSDAHAAACAVLGRKLADERIAETVEQFVLGGGRARFDDLCEKLRQAYQSIAVEEMLARDHREYIDQLVGQGADPEEIVKVKRWQAGAEERLDIQRQRAAALEKMIAEERRRVQDQLKQRLAKAASDLANERAGVAATIRGEIEKQLLNKLQQEAELRIIAVAITSTELRADAVRLFPLPDVPKPRTPEPAKLIGFADDRPCNPASESVAAQIGRSVGY